MEQTILTLEDGYESLDQYLVGKESKAILLVCGRSFRHLKISRYFCGAEARLGVHIVRFDDFQPNPLYESVVKGVRVFQENDCGAIVAVGGGSAIDVAKCIKLYSNMDPSRCYLEQPIRPDPICFIAIPTTAGTGSEATRYAVIYHQGEKLSITDASCIPSVVLMDPSTLETLPVYQKKATMLDALCHGIESFWSVHSTKESKAYARAAIRMLLAHKDAYLMDGEDGKEGGTAGAAMLCAANLAGRAIDITQTTAGHAMSYKLTSLYGIAHGHAVALCVSRLWPYMLAHMEDCIDPRGSGYLRSVFGELAEAFGCRDEDEAAVRFEEILHELELKIPRPAEGHCRLLGRSVNVDRLKNNPVRLDGETLKELYRQILKEQRPGSGTG